MYGERLSVLFDHATAWLHREKVLLPGVSVLTRLVAAARERAVANLYEVVVERPRLVDTVGVCSGSRL